MENMIFQNFLLGFPSPVELHNRESSQSMKEASVIIK